MHRVSPEDEIVRLRAEVAILETRQSQLVQLFAAYLRQPPTDDPERLRRRDALADMSLMIVGGTAAVPGELDECAAIGVDDGLEGLTGGSGVLVSPRIVVTAGHNGQLGHMPDPTDAGLRLTDVTDLSGAEVIPGRFKVNPNFVRIGRPNDIGVLILEQASTVCPVPLATTAEMAAATEVTLAGFGVGAVDGKKGFGIKRSVTVPIQFLAGGVQRIVPSSVKPNTFDHALEFLVGAPMAGACFGDSGGPAYIDVGGQRKVAGIVSRPPQGQKPPCKGFTICTRADVFAGWIQQQTP